MTLQLYFREYLSTYSRLDLYQFYFIAMNIEKQITITDLRAKFTKDFDTFGKMDPFLEFTIGKLVVKTEVAHSGGKQPTWKNPIVITYFDETVLFIKSYDEDTTENQYMGSGKMQIKALRFPGGALEVNILSDNGEIVGTIFGKYTIKNLNPIPMLIVKSVKCQFVKQHSFILKTKPYIQINCDDNSSKTQAKQDGSGLNLSWNDSLRIKIKENSKLLISLLDKGDASAYIFRYEASVKQFKLQTGSRKFNVFDNKYEYLGAVLLDFQTVNLVTKQQSVKTLQKEKKLSTELTSINIDKIKTDLIDGNKDIYYHFAIGTNRISSDVIKQVPKSSSLELKKVIYTDHLENKMHILIWESNLLKDKVIASNNVLLEGLSSGEKKIQLFDEDKKPAGFITLSLNVKQVPAKIISIDNINIEFTEGTDIIGQSQPYVIMRVGGASNRTETGNKNKVAFKRSFELKYSDEEHMDIEVWDEDVTNDQLMFKDKLKVSELKGSKGQHTIKITKTGSSNQKATVNFRYEIKNYAPAPIQIQNKKMSQKKTAQVPPPQPIKKQTVAAMPVESPRQVVQQKHKQSIKHSQQVKVQGHSKKNSIKVSSPPPLENSQNQRSSRRTQESPEDYKRNQSLNPDKSSRLKSSVRLPTIQSNHLNYGDRIFDKQSAATLQKTIVAYSMPKGPRFTNGPKYSGEPSYCIDTCFKSSSTKGVGFGFGRKKQFPDWVQRNMKENPAPGAYLQDNALNKSKGPTFGISHKFYQKVLIPKEKPIKLQPLHSGKGIKGSK